MTGARAALPGLIEDDAEILQAAAGCLRGRVASPWGSRLPARTRAPPSRGRAA